VADNQRMLDRFVRLCEISSPTGDERAAADAVLAELGDLGVDAREDGAAGPARAGAGNVLARIPGAGEGWVLLCAHLDTVPHDSPVEVELSDGVYRSRGDTILGADNKAAVTVLMELAARHVSEPPPIGLELAFTVAEEDGLRGAKALDLDGLSSRYAFVFDHATPIGEVIVAAPSNLRLVVEFEGEEAHAGIKPEAGHNAIVAAAASIAEMRLGRLDEETTANVGVIAGGTATNVVAGHCRLEGEARSLDAARASEVIGAMTDACTWAAGEQGCDLSVDVTEMFRAYRVPRGSTALAIATEALERCGHEAREVATGGGSDANALMAAGFEAVLLANGTEANHTPEESVAAQRIVEMLDVAEAILDRAAAHAGGGE
jgi:tripeptide aminopeptidase